MIDRFPEALTEGAGGAAAVIVPDGGGGVERPAAVVP